LFRRISLPGRRTLRRRDFLRYLIKVFPEPYGTCHVPQYKLSGGYGSLSAATEAICDSLKVEFSAFGVYGGVDRKFGEKESDDVTTFYIGYGFKKALAVDVGGITRGAR
jgi:hypothetical protein